MGIGATGAVRRTASGILGQHRKELDALAMRTRSSGPVLRPQKQTGAKSLPRGFFSCRDQVLDPRAQMKWVEDDYVVNGDFDGQGTGTEDPFSFDDPTTPVTRFDGIYAVMAEVVQEDTATGPGTLNFELELDLGDLGWAGLPLADAHFALDDTGDFLVRSASVSVTAWMAAGVEINLNAEQDSGDDGAKFQLLTFVQMLARG